MDGVVQLGETIFDGLGVAAQDHEAWLVGDGALVGDSVELGGMKFVAQLGDQDLDFEGFCLR